MVSEDRAQEALQPPPAAGLSQLLRGSLVTQLINVAGTLGVADLLCDGPKNSHELAAALKVDPEALYRVLRALASIGIFEETDPRRFALTSLAQPLRTDVPGSLRASAMLYGEPWWWRACGDLLHSVRTGQPAFDHVHGESLFAYLRHAADAAAIFNDHQTNMTRQDAAAVKVQLQYLDIRDPKDIEAAFRAASKGRADAVLVLTGGGVINSQRTQVVELAVKSRLPAIYYAAEWVEDGGLMSYATSVTDLYRRAATYVDKILKGAKPADLPIEQPKKFEFIINLKAAKQIGLTIPPNVLARADKVMR
jgi:hypothetical protein